MNAIKNKIRSRKGASITFALLIFLVCAIISGVVIVAGSTAAGRMSQIAQSDQRYYAVTSAAGLLRDEIDGMRVTVSYKLDASGQPIADSNQVTKVASVAVNSTTGVETETPITPGLRKILEDATLKLALKDKTPHTLTLEVQGYDTLKCLIVENVMPDEGQLIYQISNVPPETDAKKTTYTLQVIFNANISESKTQGISGETVVTNVVKWSFAGVKKGALPTTT